MEENSTSEREEILANAKYESELSDLKQHADKMIRGFENFNSFSSNRAVWELIQNACDLSENCEVIIDYSDNGFSFTHNGAPFTTNSLISLIKQVSGKYGDESEIPEVGKYGTGFLTTHTFGRKFEINSVLIAKDRFFEIRDFIVDRTPKEWKQLSQNIKSQKEAVYQIIKAGTILPEHTNKTTFTFRPDSETEVHYINESYKDLEDYIPIVLTINERLNKVKIITDDNRIVFKRVSKTRIPNIQGINLYKTSIILNDDLKVIYSLVDESEQIEIILPVNVNLEVYSFSKRIARLFLYYPLIGSEDFGLNFIINCKKFLPTEPRDGIHLKSNKEQVREQEEANSKLIQKASKLIFDFLRSNVLKVSNPFLYAKIDFQRDSENILLNDYFESLQALWTEEFKTLPIVETSIGFRPVNDVCFLEQDILDIGSCLDDIYEIASKFKDNLPLRSNIEIWSDYTNEWANDSLIFVGHKHIVEYISQQDLSSFNKQTLINYYRNLINTKKTIYFSEFTLLPNLDGKFHNLAHLLSPKDFNETLIKIGKELIPDSIDRLVHPDFYFDFNFENFTRRGFSNDVKAKLDELEISTKICLPLSTELEDYNEIDSSISKVNLTFFENLIQYCKLSYNITSQSRPINLIKIICNYYKLDDNLIELSKLEGQEENIDIRSTRKILAQVFFNLLQFHNEDWVKRNIELLLKIANCNEDSLKEVYLSAKIFPNQINQLWSVNNLKRDLDVLTEIKDLYNTVNNDEIRKILVYKEFNRFIADDRSITTKYLSTQIEETFFKTDINDINEHPFKEEILYIISKLSEKEYAELFPRLDGKKASLMLEIVTNENTKEDIFSIVTLKEAQLKNLGKLVKEENFEDVLKVANKLIEQQIESDSDFRHKYEIGTNIERLIREKLSSELRDRVTFVNSKEIEASDVQGGQDIVIIVDGKPFYFIEVKSRWNPVNSVSMSKLQLQKAVEQNKNYALCSVDITKYSGTNDKYNLPIEEVLPLTKFITNIGDTIKPLIEENLSAEKNQMNSIHLIEYRGIIPQEIIKIGEDFSSFANTLVVKINKKIQES